MYLRFLSFCKNLNCRDSYGMTKFCFYVESHFMLKLQPDLSGNPFLLILQVLLKLRSSAKKIDFVEPIRYVWERKAY